ncbi:MAG: protein BatD [Bacteroidetes bacterium]|nr:protein BatD [Bacteroidota bacterium]
MKRMRWFSMFFSLLALSLSLGAQQIQVSVQPTSPVVNQPFQISYDISGLAGQYKLPAFDGLLKLGTSQQQSIINGVSTFKISVRLMSRTAGKISVAPFQLLSNGRVLAQSAPVQLTILDETQGNAANQQNKPPVKKADNQIFAVARLEKSSVFVGEPLTVSIDLYSKYSSVQFESVKFPSLNGGWVQDIPEAEDQQFRQTQVEGEPFLVATLKKYVLVPQVQGKITIDPLLASVVVSYREASSDPFDVFFGGRVVEKKVELKTPRVSINALPIPFEGRPADFTNGVGDFQLEVKPGSTTLNVNDAFDLSVLIKGNGNLNLLELPKLNMPAEFDAFAPDVQDKISFSEAGVSGTKQVNYIYIAKTPGTYVLPPFTWSWFNPKTKKFESFTSDSVRVQVLGSANNAETISKGPIKFQVSIPQGRTSILPPLYVPFYGSISFFVLLSLLLALILLYAFWAKNWLVALRNRGSRTSINSAILLNEIKSWNHKPSKESTVALINTMESYLRDQWSLSIAQQSTHDLINLFGPMGQENAATNWSAALQQLHFMAYASSPGKDDADRLAQTLRQTVKSMESCK